MSLEYEAQKQKLIKTMENEYRSFVKSCLSPKQKETFKEIESEHKSRIYIFNRRTRTTH